MRKIYSLVLMTAMLFIGTNAWGTTVHSVATDTDLRNAFSTASTGDTIRLTAAINQTQCILIDDGREFILDMKGFTIDFAATTGKDPVSFKMTHGALTVIGGGTIKNSTVASSYKFEEKEVKVFALQGSTASNAENYTVLTVGPGTTVDCVSGKNGIEVDQNGSSHKAFGVCVNFAGTCHGEKYGIQLSGNVSAVPGKDGIPENAKFPYFHIQTGAWVYANSSNAKAVGVYSGGYGIWKIEGKVEGSTGVYVKGGKVEINNATITSTNTTGHGVESSKTSGVDAGGSAIVTESNNSYAGNISVTVSGSSTVSTQSPNGYAIQDTTTTSNNSEVMDVTITGGTITGGTNGGAVKIDNKTGEVVTVTGGTFTGDIQTLIDHVDDETSIIQDVVADDGQGNATVVIGKKETGDEIADTSTEDLKQDFVFTNNMANEIVKLDATNANIVKTLPDGTTTVKYLSLTGTGTYISQVTVGSGKTLKVDQIVMNANGQIVVEAGAQLLVTGSNGIFADNVNNLILRSSADAQATLVISPEVTSNRQPKATTELTTSARKVSETNYIWQRFAPPVLSTMSFTKSESVPTSLRVVDVLTETWVDVTDLNQLRVFNPAAITNTSAGGVVYSFTGRLAGNVIDSIQLLNTKWNYFGNSYIAPMSIRDLLDTLLVPAQGVDATVYLWNTDAQTYDVINKASYLMYDPEDPATIIPDSIPSMEFFVVLNRSRRTGIMDINYKKSIYDYAVTPTNYRTLAPARQNGNINTMRISVSSLNGVKDNVRVVESNNYSSEFENGYDAEKLMNNGLNLYISDEQDLSTLATDNVIGTQLTMQTIEDVNYTFTFSNVRGEHYALRDNMTGRVVEMMEGGQYTFSAQPNETIEGRFEIVGRQEMPTAVETIETESTVKAVYTILGQYVGDSSNWENLPAGIYVVDGVKIVK